jgi:hypothetical protein
MSELARESSCPKLTKACLVSQIRQFGTRRHFAASLSRPLELTCLRAIRKLPPLRNRGESECAAHRRNSNGPLD